MTFLEGESRKSWVKFVKDKKAETIRRKFKTTLKVAERQVNRKLKGFYHNEGTEYANADALCKDKGIQVRRTAAYADEQNGAPERLNKILIK